MKKLKVAVITALGVTTLTGCMGQMGVTGMVTKGNLVAVDNRYAREGLFILLSPVYGVASIADLFIFNAIEFWTGTNPITGKSPAVVDKDAETMFKVNDKLDKSLTTVPVQANNRNIKQAQFAHIDDNTLEMTVDYIDGTHQSLRGVKNGDMVTFYRGQQEVTTVSMQVLEDYAASARS